MENEIPHEENLMKELENKIFKRKLILWYRYIKKLKPKEICEETGIHVKTIYHFLDKWHASGVVEDLTRTGRPVEMSKTIQDKIIKIQLDDRFKSKKDVFNEIRDYTKDNPKYNCSSYYQVASQIDKNFTSIIAPYSIDLSATNILKRIEFCKFYLNLRNWRRKKIIWTDEKVFRLYPQNRKFTLKILKNQEESDVIQKHAITKKQQGGASVMFWGAIGSEGKVCLFEINEKFDSLKFAKFLDEIALPAIYNKIGPNFTLQQDNCPIHKGKTLDLLKLRNVQSLDWPAQSPDLNPIENVWGWMANKIGPKMFKNKKELAEYVFQVWQDLPDEIFANFIDNIAKKMEWVLDNQGKIFKQY